MFTHPGEHRRRTRIGSRGCSSDAAACRPADGYGCDPPAAGQRAGGPPGGGGGPGGGRGRVVLSPDSLAALRKPFIDQLNAQIKGHESDPAENIFQNVQILKTLTAQQFVTRMEAYGRALGMRCSDCHVTSNFASDTVRAKKTARVMTQIVADINAQEMPKMNANNPPQVSCMTCHHGMNQPSRNVDGALTALNTPKPPGGG